MASNYPGSLDSFDTIASDKKASDAVGGRTHRDMHNDLGDAIESVQTELGVNPSGSDATVAARLAAIVTSGASAPEGVVTASPLTRYRQTSGAATATGAMEWVKATGTGNTGWQAGPEADTGWRNVSGSLNAAWALHSVAGILTVRRIGNLVTLTGRLERVTASGNRTAFSNIYSTPAGFIPAVSVAGHVYGVLGNGYYTAGAPQALISNINDSAVVEASIPGGTGTWAAGDDLIFKAQWITSDAWPSSLPGSAA